VNEAEFSGPFVITGLSGSGKTVLSRSLEDLGYLCVDNIPLDMVPELFSSETIDLTRLVVVVDVRTTGLTEKFPAILKQLADQSSRFRVVFVEASPVVLLRRFSIARRPHPLRDRSLEQAIAEEREALQGLRDAADLVIDTTHLTPHDLKRQILTLAGTSASGHRMMVTLQSFSYLQGVPATASLVFDVRFLPNPYFEPDLRSLAGDDEEVVKWFEDLPEVADAARRIEDLILFVLPKYEHELKAEVTIAMGCTGGRHRSVYLADRMAGQVAEAGYDVVVHHRDKDRWRYS
jgi:UPF0042 nucleotide-binding protein